MQSRNIGAYAESCDDFKDAQCKGYIGVEGDYQCPKKYEVCCAYCEENTGCPEFCPMLTVPKSENIADDNSRT